MDSRITLWEAGSDTKCTVVNVHCEGEETLLDMYVRREQEAGFRRFKRAGDKWIPLMEEEKLELVPDDPNDGTCLLPIHPTRTFIQSSILNHQVKIENQDATRETKEQLNVEQKGDDDVKSTDYGCETHELLSPDPEDEEF